MSVHGAIVSRLFGEGFSNEDVASFLFKTGLVFTAIQSVMAFFTPAFYGRYRDRLGSMKFMEINATVAWSIQESPSFFIPAILVAETFGQLNSRQIILLAAFMGHYFQRSFIFPLLIKSDKSVPFSIVASAFCFCSFNGFFQAHCIIYCTNFTAGRHLDAMFIFGMVTFVSGMAINLDSDRRLRNLRSDKSTGYKIPKGGFFEFVSAGNYFGEMWEWIGYALAARHVGGYFFAIFSAAFLGPRGYQHHKFYLEKFQEYPINRKAIIPFLL